MGRQTIRRLSEGFLSIVWSLRKGLGSNVVPFVLRGGTITIKDFPPALITLSKLEGGYPTDQLRLHEPRCMSLSGRPPNQPQKQQQSRPPRWPDDLLANATKVPPVGALCVPDSPLHTSHISSHHRTRFQTGEPPGRSGRGQPLLTSWPAGPSIAPSSGASTWPASRASRVCVSGPGLCNQSTAHARS